MSSIEDSFYSALVAQASITATVATLPTTAGSGYAITPFQAIEKFSGAFPRIVFNKDSDEPVYSDAGAATVSRAKFSVECQATTIALAEAVRDAVKAYLSGTGNSTTFGSKKLAFCFVSDSDVFYPAVHGEEVGVRAKSLDVDMGYF